MSSSSIKRSTRNSNRSKRLGLRNVTNLTNNGNNKDDRGGLAKSRRDISKKNPAIISKRDVVNDLLQGIGQLSVTKYNENNENGTIHCIHDANTLVIHADHDADSDEKRLIEALSRLKIAFEREDWADYKDATTEARRILIHDQEGLCKKYFFNFEKTMAKIETGRFEKFYSNTDKILGEGSFGKVCLGRDEILRKAVAIKIITITKPRSRKKESRQAHRLAFYAENRAEVELWSKLDHPNIVPLFDHFYLNDSLLFVMELQTGGSLEEYIEKKTRLSETEGRLVLQQGLLATSHMFERNIAHRDIKPDNMLVTLTPNGSLALVQLADFGTAVELTDNTIPNFDVGSDFYQAPEVRNMPGYPGGKDLLAAADIYSMGMTALIGLYGYPQVQEDEIWHERWNQSSTIEWLHDNLPSAYPTIQQMVDEEPRKRGTQTDLLEHAWFVNE